MSISVSQAFKRTSANPVDETLTLTKAQMLAINDNLMPSKYLTICQDDGYIYLYDKSATPDAQTGKFSKFEGGGQVDTSKLYSTDDSASTDIADGDYFPFYDTSATSKKKSLWSNVKSVLKTYFDGLYQKTLTAGTNITISGTTISSVGATDATYSTTERAIGKWVDNKTLYQKTINFGTLPNTTTKQVATGISNLSRIVSFDGYAYRPSDGSIFYINRPSVNNDNASAITCGARGSNVEIYCGMDRTAFTECYITIKYTKTT